MRAKLQTLLQQIDRRFGLTVVVTALAVFALAFGLGRSGLIGGSKGPPSASAKVVPTIAPVVLEKVTPAKARAENAKVPVLPSAGPAAPAYLASGDAPSRERARDCLAAAIFYEAGQESDAGKQAVAQVVLNRLRHPAFPKSVCGVVFQGQERQTGCQFSFTCDGAMARKPEPAQWEQNRAIASAMLNGLVYAPVGLATHYHTDWVLPRWSARMDKVRIERTHLFFRFAGFWGKAQAFTGKPLAQEPMVPKLAALSAAHGGQQAETSETFDQAFADLATLGNNPEKLDERIATSIGGNDAKQEVFLIYVDPLLDAQSLIGTAEGACGKRKICKVFAWADPALLPEGLPLEPQDRASMAFSYIRLTDTARPKARWNCALFPRDNARECL